MEEVVLEYIDDTDRVAVVPVYDKETKSIGSPIEVTTKFDAEEKYSVIGYIIDGEVQLHEETEDYEIDYYSEFGIEEDD